MLYARYTRLFYKKSRYDRLGGCMWYYDSAKGFIISPSSGQGSEWQSGCGECVIQSVAIFDGQAKNLLELVTTLEVGTPCIMRFIVCRSSMSVSEWQEKRKKWKKKESTIRFYFPYRVLFFSIVINIIYYCLIKFLAKKQPFYRSFRRKNDLGPFFYFIYR